jgi:ribosomal protein S18 acetylase RimI-like enzyme
MDGRVIIRRSTTGDIGAIYDLYRQASAIPGGLARSPGEISYRYAAAFLRNSYERGLSLVLDDGDIIGEMHAYRPEAKVFYHVLSDLTICIHQDRRSRGLGRVLFHEFMATVEDEMPAILLVELITRETNGRAIGLYLSEGFQAEGRLMGRIAGLNGIKDDIPMAWTRQMHRSQ